MKRASGLRAFWACLLLVLSGAAFAQTKQTDVQTPAGKFRLEVAPEYLGMAGAKTVVRLRLTFPDLSKAAKARGVAFVSGKISGDFKSGDQVADAFSYP
jgi:hypothetical protein